MIRKHFRLKKIALGLAFAAIVVPTAQARVVIDGYPATASYTARARPVINGVDSAVARGPDGSARRLSATASHRATTPVRVLARYATTSLGDTASI